MKRFFIDLKKYAEYICYSGIANLKAEVSGSFLNWTWWILDTFLHMMVYAFISLVVFGRSEPHFIPFVFVGQAVWKYVNSTVMCSVEMIRKNKSVLRRIYLPKQILLLSNQFGFFVQLLITLGITLAMCILDGVQFTWYVLWLPVILAILLLGSFGIGCILLHVGVYAKDMWNVLGVCMKLTFYLSGIFYNLQARVPAPYGDLLVSVNPAAMIIHEARSVLVYGTAPNYLRLAVWAVISALLTAYGVNLIYRHEQNYIKAV